MLIAIAYLPGGELDVATVLKVGRPVVEVACVSEYWNPDMLYVS
jgi:hypothetical protein